MDGIHKESGLFDGIDWGQAQQLVQNIAQFRNPHRQVQLDLQKQIAANPELAQQFAMMAHQNPEMVTGLFGKQATGLFGNTQLDLPNQIKQDSQGAYNSGQSMDQLMGNNTVKGQVLAKAMTGQDAVGYGTAKATQQNAQTNADVNAATKGAQIESGNLDPKLKAAQLSLSKNALTQSDQQITDLQTSLAAHPDLKGLNIGNVAADIYHGKNVDPTVVGRINAAGLDKTVQQMVTAMQQRDQERAQWDLATFRVNSKKLSTDDKINIYQVVNQQMGQAQREIAQYSQEYAQLTRTVEYQAYAKSIQGKDGKKLQETLAGSEGAQAYQRAEGLRGQLINLQKDFNENLKPKNELLFNDLYSRHVNGQRPNAAGSGKVSESTSASATVKSNTPAPTLTPEQLAAIKSNIPAMVDDYAAGALDDSALSRLPSAISAEIKAKGLAKKAANTKRK